MRSPISIATHRGVSAKHTPPEARRIQTINIVTMLAILFNLAFSVTYSMFLDRPNMWRALAGTAVFIIGYAMGLSLNGRGLTESAMWTTFIVGFGNTLVASLLLGTGSGAQFFFAVLPVAAVLTTRPGATSTQVMFLIASSIGFGVVAAIDPSTPGTIAGSSAEIVLRVGNFVSVSVFVTAMVLSFRRRADRAEADLIFANARSEFLLLNILPEDIANRLKGGESVIADKVEDVAVLFADLVDSTPLSELLTATELVKVLNSLFTSFDELTDRFGLEKIKTVGDAYMVVGGLTTPGPDHLVAIADLALALTAEVATHTVAGFGRLQMRTGIHIGPVVAGVIGTRKITYDLWGKTVNTAARMESHGVPGRIQITSEVAARLAPLFDVEERGPVEIKGMGQVTTFFLGLRSQHSR